MNTTTVWVIAGVAVLLLWLKGQRQKADGVSPDSVAAQGEAIIPDNAGRDTSPPMTLEGMAERLARMKTERGPYDY